MSSAPAAAGKMRLDMALVARGLVASRARARDAILRGHVTVDQAVATRPGAEIGGNAEIAVHDPAGRYVSRSALKLVAGLDHFGYPAEGRVALDLGASTGGFTQVLLERGAAAVLAVDVGHGQLAPLLRDDPRVIGIEGLNARDLTRSRLRGLPPAFGAGFGTIVADLSFISLRLALPPALALSASGAWGVFLVKPQFEVGRAAVGKGGIIRDRDRAQSAAEDVAAWLAGSQGWHVDGLLASPIAGSDGNVEFLLGARRD